MKILVALNHPAHYYVFKYTVIKLKRSGLDVLYVIRDKDILEKLLVSENVEFLKIGSRRVRNASFFSIISNGIVELISQELNLLKFIRKWKPDLMIGTDIAITHTGFLLGIPSFVFNEDDFEINKLFCNFAYPFATKIISPDICSVGRFQKKKVSYNGFQKMAYLHPDYFYADRTVIEDIIDREKKYFLIRLVSLTAGHDIEGKHTGLSEQLVENIINELSPKGKIFITSERKLNPKFEKYRLQIAPNKMHHLMAFASIFIGDSQTMCAEAGLLGTPFIRFNDFVGKISYLNELEGKYELGFGIKTNSPEKVLEYTRYILSLPEAKELWKEKKKKIFEDKIDVAQWYTDAILNQLANS